ncbi:MAG: carboxypeptidase regulatory-like domain-containing protein [Candidatus Binataceae bacterium]
MKLIVAAIAIILAAASLHPAGAYEAIAVTDGGAISGTVTYQGVAPRPARIDVTRDKKVCAGVPHLSEALVVGPNGGIKDAIVAIPDIAKGESLKAETNVKFDQRGCVYQPHVLAFPAGSTVEVLNSDNLLHDLRTYSNLNPPLNLAQPKSVKSIKLVIEKPELVRVGCYIHTWMQAWWYVAANPYYAVSAADGSFAIRNLPAGNYTVSVWQGKLGRQEQPVTVKPGATTNVNFVYGANPQPAGDAATLHR